MNTIAAKYGFEYVGGGCVIRYSPDEKEYAELVTEYLKKRNGEGWEKRYYQELEAMKQVQFSQQ